MVAEFIRFLNRRFRARYALESQPDPPEAIIRSSRRRRWVELADIFYSADYAHDVLSYATPGERHHSTSGIVQHDVDGRLAREFVRVLRRKLTKKSYIPVRDRFGPGFLILAIHHPWFDGRTVADMRAATRAAAWHGDLGCFASVFICVREGGGYAYRRWRYA
jgi:hypothetical protein